eukprot:272687_1
MMYWFLLILAYVVSADISGNVVMNGTQALKVTVTPGSTNGGTVELVFSGNDGGWFAVGFNNTDMKATYSIVVDCTGITYEYYLGSGTCSPGCDTMLSNTYSVKSNSVQGNVRTVDITRPVNDNNNGAMYYNFPTSASSIQLIWAYGVAGQQFKSATSMANHGEIMLKLS